MVDGVYSPVEKGKSMAQIVWTEQFNIGIDAIDNQHRKIADYINLLDSSDIRRLSREEVSRLICDLTDYTISHFGFEERLQEDAGYPYLKAHQRVHGLFTKRVASFQTQHETGEDISDDLSSFLITWLVNHIQHEDGDYAETVKKYLQLQHDYIEKKKGLFARLFR
jgi:hemerythrin